MDRSRVGEVPSLIPGLDGLFVILYSAPRVCSSVTLVFLSCRKSIIVWLAHCALVGFVFSSPSRALVLGSIPLDLKQLFIFL